MSDETAAADRLAELRSSAKGWHSIQLAALGFIGLCGVLQTGDAEIPWSLQVVSGILVLVAFALACQGIYLVGRAAWPLYGAETEPAQDGDAAAVARASASLRSGLKATFLSIAVLAFATASSWWPHDASASGGGGEVTVQTSSGESVCGALAASPQAGTMRVVSGGQAVDVGFESVASVMPVDSC